jgi:ABC-type Fe3+/spermidine/putrescine transport system ATPase subunit
MTVKQNIEFGLKIMRKQKSGVDAADLKEKETVKNNAEKKAARKIKSLTKDLENLNNDIAKLDAKYESKPE